MIKQNQKGASFSIQPTLPFFLIPKWTHFPNCTVSSSPIIHEHIRLPQLVGSDTKVLNTPIVAVVPPQIVIIPFLSHTKHMLIKERDRLPFHISIRIVGNSIVFNSACVEIAFSLELIIFSFIYSRREFQICMIC